MTTGTGLFRNTSNQRVILRCIGPEAFFQVEVVFPFENWRFRSPPPGGGLTQENRGTSALSYGLEGRTSVSPPTEMPTTR